MVPEATEESEPLEIDVAEQTIVQGQRRRPQQQDEAAIARYNGEQR